MIKPSEGGPNFADEAIVVFKLYGKGRSMKDNYYVQTVFQEIGSPTHFVRFPSNKKHEVFHIKAGRYYISLLAASEVVLNTEAKVPLFKNDTSIPVMPIDIKPGEVVYLGTLIAEGIRHNQIMTRKDDAVSFSVVDEFDLAKKELEEKYPDDAHKLQSKLFEPIN